jgi:hypothetical protein
MLTIRFSKLSDKRLYLQYAFAHDKFTSYAFGAVH